MGKYTEKEQQDLIESQKREIEEILRENHQNFHLTGPSTIVGDGQTYIIGYSVRQPDGKFSAAPITLPVDGNLINEAVDASVACIKKYRVIG